MPPYTEDPVSVPEVEVLLDEVYHGVFVISRAEEHHRPRIMRGDLHHPPNHRRLLPIPDPTPVELPWSEPILELLRSPGYLVIYNEDPLQRIYVDLDATDKSLRNKEQDVIAKLFENRDGVLLNFITLPFFSKPFLLR